MVIHINLRTSDMTPGFKPFTVLRNLHSIVYRGFSIHIWFGGISAMDNKKLNLKGLSCISCYMKRSIISLLLGE